jgi:DNA processing protein
MNTRAWLTLAHAYVTANELGVLRERFGGATAIVARNATDLRNAGLSADKAQALTNVDHKALDAALEWLSKDRHHIVCLGDDDYPDLLAEIPGAPLLLYVNGSVDALHLPSLAIVGSRNPTRGGVRNAVEFSRYLAGGGFCIVSGLAEGIDTAAHRGALQCGEATIAFLGHGIDRVYPAKNRELAHEIASHGALVSEFPLGTAPHRRHFPERNRLISGLSLGVLVIEAARQSGSLITARLAAEQGREVFALPGSIHNPLARGCHSLIRQGAKLVETGSDIVSELAPLAGRLQQTTAQSTSNADRLTIDDSDYVQLRKYLGHDPVGIDDLVDQSGLTIEALSSMLLILELHGEVESLSGGRYALCR